MSHLLETDPPDASFELREFPEEGPLLTEIANLHQFSLDPQLLAVALGRLLRARVPLDVRDLEASEEEVDRLFDHLMPRVLDLIEVVTTRLGQNIASFKTKTPLYFNDRNELLSLLGPEVDSLQIEDLEAPGVREMALRIVMEYMSVNGFILPVPVLPKPKNTDVVDPQPPVASAKYRYVFQSLALVTLLTAAAAGGVLGALKFRGKQNMEGFRAQVAAALSKQPKELDQAVKLLMSALNASLFVREDDVGTLKESEIAFGGVVQNIGPKVLEPVYNCELPDKKVDYRREALFFAESEREEGRRVWLSPPDDGAGMFYIVTRDGNVPIGGLADDDCLAQNGVAGPGNYGIGMLTAGMVGIDGKASDVTVRPVFIVEMSDDDGDGITVHPLELGAAMPVFERDIDLTTIMSAVQNRDRVVSSLEDRRKKNEGFEVDPEMLALFKRAIRPTKYHDPVRIEGGNGYFRGVWYPEGIDHVQDSLALAFARLGKAAEVRDWEFRGDLYRSREKLALKYVRAGRYQYGASSWRDKSGELMLEVNFDNLDLDRGVAGFLREWLRLIEMDAAASSNPYGVVELQTLIAMPETPDIFYPTHALLAAALGEKFYLGNIMGPRKYAAMMQVEERPDGRVIANSSGMSELVEAFAERWKIYPRYQNELASIFELHLGQRDSDDAKRRAMRLREILFECGVDWLEFLMAINPNGAEGLLKYWFAI